MKKIAKFWERMPTIMPILCVYEKKLKNQLQYLETVCL